MMSQLRQNLLAKGKNAYLSLNHAKSRELFLYFLLLLFLPTQLGKHFWPAYSLVSGFRVDYLSPTLYVTDILVLLLCLQWLLPRTRSVGRHTLTQLLPYLFALIYLGITILPSVSWLTGLYGIGKIAEVVFIGYFTARYILLPAYQRSVYVVFMLTVSFQALLALAQVVAKGYLGGMFYYLGERAITSLTPGAATAVLNGEIFLRSYGTFSHPNVLSGFLVISMTYLYLNRATLTRKKSFWLLGIVLLLGSLGLCTTLSRLPLLVWALFLIGAGIVFIRAQLRNPSALPRRLIARRGGVVAFLVVVILSASFPLFSSVMTRFTQSAVSEESFLVRQDLNTIAIAVIREHQLLGVGLGNFIYSAVTYKRPEDPLYFATQPVHNIFLLVTAETGILGLFIFLWCLVHAFAHASRAGRILLAITLFLGMFDHYFLTLQQGQLLFGFVVGYCYASRKSSGNNY